MPILNNSVLYSYVLRPFGRSKPPSDENTLIAYQLRGDTVLYRTFILIFNILIVHS
jgi:hypothetical protein